MKSCLLIVLGVLLSLLASGQKQTTKIDSLVNELNNAEDVEKSDIMLHLALEYSNLDSFTTSIKYSKKSL